MDYSKKKNLKKNIQNIKINRNKSNVDDTVFRSCSLILLIISLEIGAIYINYFEPKGKQNNA